MNCRCTRTIEERLNNNTLSNKEWPPKGIEMKDIPNASAVNELMESSAREYALCLLALRKCHDDQTEALNLLLDASRSDALERDLPSNHSPYPFLSLPLCVGLHSVALSANMMCDSVPISDC